VYSREIDGQEYTFGVSGKLIMNTLVMYDRQTNSLWGQILGEAVEGPLKGTELEFIPAIHTNWADWKVKYPGTLALVKGYSGVYSSYERYFNDSQAGVIGETVQDDRLRTKEFVLGVEHEGLAVAYPYRVLNDQPVVNDQLGQIPVLVVFNSDAGAAVVFNRRLEDGSILTFSAVDQDTLVDAETGSIWNAFQGAAVDGPLAGEQLAPLKYTLVFWFGWKDWYPETRVFGQ
jgi:hypothetical protein